MHVDHELVEFVPVDKQEYDKVIEEYEEEILVQEGAPKPIGADLTDPSPAQGKPRCITPIFNDHCRQNIVGSPPRGIPQR